jgi:hypothetical protein
MKRTEERIRGDKYDKSTLYVFMEISQWNPFVQTIYTKKKKKIVWSSIGPKLELSGAPKPYRL